MPSIVQPLNSKVMITPYSQRLLQFGIEDSKIYLSKATNSLLSPFLKGYGSGFLEDIESYSNKPTYDSRDGCIIDGLETSWELDGTNFIVKVSPGSLIVDTTFLVLPFETTLDLDLETYGDHLKTGKIILSVNFQWVESVYDMPPKLKLSYLSPDNNQVVEPNGWFLAQDKLIINIFDFKKAFGNAVLEDSIISHYPDPCRSIKKEMIVIKDFPYEIAPLPKFIYNIYDTIDKNYIRKIVEMLYGGLNPENLPGSTVSFDIELQNIAGNELLEVHFNIKYDPLLVSNPTAIIASSATNASKNLTFTIDTSSNDLQILISGNNMIEIADGKIATITFDINPIVPKNTPIAFSLNSMFAINNQGDSVILNGTGQPEIYGELNHTVTRITGSTLHPEIPLNQLWHVGTPPELNDMKLYYFKDIDISSLNSSDVLVQCFVDNQTIIPAFIEMLPLVKKVRIWMPQGYFDKDSIPDMKVIIVG